MRNLDLNPQPAPSPRVRRLLEQSQPTGQEKTWYPTGFDERAVLLWQYFQSAEDEPLPLRFAHGLGYVMEKIAIAMESSYTRKGKSSALSGRITTNCNRLAALATTIA